MSAPRVATAFAPASVGNAAVGFDILGFALRAPRDIVTVTRTDEPGIRLQTTGDAGIPVPLEPRTNTAGRALIALLERIGGKGGFEVMLTKRIPLGAGMGGSAASAVAAVVAANGTLDTKLPLEILYDCAMEGEVAASGARHGDNVGGALVGGLVICPKEGCPVAVPVPPWLYAAVVRPNFILETRTSRKVLEVPFGIKDIVAQITRLSMVLAGCYTSDAELIRRGLEDVLVEPRRADLIPGFRQVKQAALDYGALGASIAGGGPSVFGWFESHAQAERAGQEMLRVFGDVGFGADLFVSPVAAPGARVLAPEELP